MLHLSTIDTPTLELLKSIMLCDEFVNLRLVGGTALALQLGHRKSIDLDLFGEINFEHIDRTKAFNNFEKAIDIQTDVHNLISNTVLVFRQNYMIKIKRFK